MGDKGPNILPEISDAAKIKKALDLNFRSKTFVVNFPGTALCQEVFL